ncbi:MAG TPA: hypothetical protein VEF76_00710 [Patescibacteria group bacterium]|nr:hypothetical protein [Patescibacteria group bacterium]
MPTDGTSSRKTARFDFNKAAQAIVADHPQLKNDTVFIDLTSGERHGPLLARVKARLSKAFRKVLARPIKRAARSPNGTASAIRGTGGLNALVMTTGRRFNLFADPAQDAAFAFYHEAAHLVVPSAAPNEANQSLYFGKLFGYPYSKAEGAADGYAALRLLQQDAGTDLTRATVMRATDVIHQDAPEYMTVFMLDAITRDAALLTKLNPAETIAAVERYAARYTPARAELDLMRADVAPLKGRLGLVTRDNLAPLRELADIALDPNSSALTFYAANRVLGAFMGRLLTGPEWAETARKLHAMEKIITLDALFPQKLAQDSRLLAA